MLRLRKPRLRLRRPTRRTAHTVWLAVSAMIALVFTRGVALPLFLGLFFVVWLLGYGVLIRLYR
jgi:uncharacterized iron-regulated membrane protein